MSSITSANSVFTLTIPGLYPAPQQLQGYSTDRAWESGAVQLTESMMSVDGRKSSGVVFNLRDMTVSLQADSPSKQIFVNLINAQIAKRDIIPFNATIDLPSTGESFIFTNGTLRSAKMLPDAAKVLQPMDFVLEWESIQPTLS